ncbi:MAG: hypothetical protein ABR577_19865, partial [Pyrinomonadaceae bacterium]
LIGIVIALLFRQVVPRLVALRNPEKTLLVLLSAFQPFYRLLSFVPIPWHRSFDRSRRERQQQSEVGANEDEETNGGDDIQALIDV